MDKPFVKEAMLSIYILRVCFKTICLGNTINYCFQAIYNKVNRHTIDTLCYYIPDKVYSIIRRVLKVLDWMVILSLA